MSSADVNKMVLDCLKIENRFVVLLMFFYFCGIKSWPSFDNDARALSHSSADGGIDDDIPSMSIL